MENPKLPKIFVIAIFSLVFIVMFGSSMFVTIEPGEKGVIFKRFASQKYNNNSHHLVLLG